MQLLRIHPSTHTVTPLNDSLPDAAPEAGGFWWLSCTRAELEAQLPALQTMLTTVCGAPLLDLHVADLLNPSIPSTYDYTSQYDVMLFHHRWSPVPVIRPPPYAPRASRAQPRRLRRCCSACAPSP